MEKKKLQDPFDYLDGYKQISLISFRKNGSKKATPVDFVRNGDVLYVETYENTYKVKRIQNNNNVEIAPCTYRGEVKGPYIQAKARILPKEEEKIASDTLNASHSYLYKLMLWLEFLARKIKFWKKYPWIYLEIKIP